jgi:cysteine desulfurase
MGCNCEIKKRLSLMAREFQGDPVYLDYNATTPTDPSLLGELDRVLRREWGNPSSIHIMGGEASLREDAARETAARYFGKPEESFLFCSSGCEGISGILSGTEAKHRRLITTVADHSVLTRSAEKLFPGRHLLAGIDGKGKIRLEEITAYLDAYPGECFLFYSPVNHETGARQEAAALFGLARERGALVFIDAVQAAYRLGPEEWAPYCHGFAISGHKFHVPKGIALIQLDRGIVREPSRFGGEDGENLFPGTPNVAGITLLGKGLELMEKNRAVNEKILATLTAEGEAILKSCRTEVIRESPADGVPGILCLSLPELGDMEKFFLHLGESRLCLSRFSACTGSVEGESEVLRAMGVPPERSTRSLRLSFGRFSKRQDFFALKEAIDSYV